MWKSSCETTPAFQALKATIANISRVAPRRSHGMPSVEISAMPAATAIIGGSEDVVVLADEVLEPRP